ncbi:MAG: hypothetical protein WDW36_005769 [Sanguina aurantia]
MADGEAAPAATLFGTLYNWGGNLVGFASQQINSLLGWEELDVVDPESEEAAKGDGVVGDGLLTDERKQAWGSKQFQQYIGLDVTSLLSVPVWIMEPFTILQKATEIMEYTEILDTADQTEDEWQRFAWVAAFAVSPFGANERAWKPFNPLLGETFELEVGNGVQYLAEQVSHHPPVCAAHAWNEHFAYDLVSAPTTRFLGNSLEVFPLGRTRVTLSSTGEVYTLTPPNAMVHNIVIGRTWIDVFGPLSLYCPTNGTKCVLEFTPCGWFSAGRYEFSGHVYDKAGAKKLKVFGNPPGHYYGFTKFAERLNSGAGIKTPLASDSRRRPDRSQLAAGNTTASGAEKYRLEEMQRAEKRERIARGEQWTPKYFRKPEQETPLTGELTADKVPFFEWNHTYEQPTQEAGKESDIDGAGFNPWQYPSIHESL